MIAGSPRSRPTRALFPHCLPSWAVADPEARPGTKACCAVSRVCEFATVKRQAAAADAFGDAELETLQFGNALVYALAATSKQAFVANEFGRQPLGDRRITSDRPCRRLRPAGGGGGARADVAVVDVRLNSVTLTDGRTLRASGSVAAGAGPTHVVTGRGGACTRWTPAAGHCSRWRPARGSIC